MVGHGAVAAARGLCFLSGCPLCVRLQRELSAEPCRCVQTTCACSLLRKPITARLPACSLAAARKACDTPAADPRRALRDAPQAPRRAPSAPHSAAWHGRAGGALAAGLAVSAPGAAAQLGAACGSNQRDGPESPRLAVQVDGGRGTKAQA